MKQKTKSSSVKKQAECKIGSTVYVVNSYNDEFAKKAIKAKIVKLIKDDISRSR